MCEPHIFDVALVTGFLTIIALLLFKYLEK